MLYGRRRLRQGGDESAATELLRRFVDSTVLRPGAAEAVTGFWDFLEEAVGRYLPHRRHEVAAVAERLWSVRACPDPDVLGAGPLLERRT